MTGFGPFPGVPTNPTEAIAEILHDQQIGDHRIVGAPLEVCFESIHRQVSVLLKAHQPRAIVLLGVAIGRNWIHLEGQAYNCREGQRPDAKGQKLRQDEPLSETQAFGSSIHTRVKRQPILDGLRFANLPSDLSEDPGRYLCNASFFHALQKSRGHTLDGHCLFVHLPQIGNPFGSQQNKKWQFEDLQHATHIILEQIERQLRESPRA